MLLIPFCAAAIPAAVTIWLPRRWLLAWLLAFWGGIILAWNSLDLTDDPAFISASIVFAPMWLVNGIATLARLALVFGDLNREWSSGYSDAE